jgi:hypothetical protein
MAVLVGLVAVVVVGEHLLVRLAQQIQVVVVAVVERVVLVVLVVLES